MDLKEAIISRKSVRAYSGREVEDEKILEVMEAARLAPSACNKQPWRFVVVRDGERRRALFEEGLGGVVSNKWAKNSPVYIVACARLDLLVHRVGALLKGLDWFLLDLGIACEHIVLRAAELGLGTCWIGWFKEKGIKKVLDIPGNIKVVSVITLGYEDKERGGVERTGRHDLDNIYSYDRWEDKLSK